VWQSFLSIFPDLLGGTMATSQTCCHLPGKMLNSAAECADRARIYIAEKNGSTTLWTPCFSFFSMPATATTTSRQWVPSRPTRPRRPRHPRCPTSTSSESSSWTSATWNSRIPSSKCQTGAWRKTNGQTRVSICCIVYIEKFIQEFIIEEFF
jgi:hypothetical protein